MAVAAAREGVTPEQLEAAIWALKRAPKGSDQEQVIREAMR